jgi:hypothetical protein
LENIVTAARVAGKKVPVLLRINPDVDPQVESSLPKHIIYLIMDVHFPPLFTWLPFVDLMCLCVCYTWERYLQLHVNYLNGMQTAYLCHHLEHLSLPD